MTPHTARATAATLALDAGAPLASVQELPGHDAVLPALVIFRMATAAQQKAADAPVRGLGCGMEAGPMTEMIEMIEMADVHEALAVIAAARAAYADGAHLRVRSSGIVHQVAMTRWLGGQLMPGPACMVGVSGWDPGAAHPDRGEVTCRRCLRLTRREGAVDQLRLFEDPGPEPETAPEPEQLPAW